MHRLARAFAALLLSLAALPLTAQQPQPDSALRSLRVGSQVRVLPLLSPGWVSGTLMRADSDSVLVYRRPQGLLIVPTWQVTRLQRQVGRDHAAGALGGLGVGLLAAIPVVALVASNPGDDPVGAVVVGGTAVVLLPLAGTIVGAIRGRPRWREVPVPRAASADSAVAQP